MIRHIVLFRYTPIAARTQDATLERLRGALAPLASSIPGVLSLRVDADPDPQGNHWHAALVSEHVSWDALVAYQAHPDHLAAIEVVNTLGSERAIVDYEV